MDAIAHECQRFLATRANQRPFVVSVLTTTKRPVSYLVKGDRSITPCSMGLFFSNSFGP